MKKNDSIVLRKQFVHKTFEERLAEYNGEITGWMSEQGGR